MSQKECHCDNAVIFRLTIISDHFSEFSERENDVFYSIWEKGLHWMENSHSHIIVLDFITIPFYLKFISIIVKGWPIIQSTEKIMSSHCDKVSTFTIIVYYDRHINQEEKKLAGAAGTYWQGSEFIQHGAYKLQFLVYSLPHCQDIRYISLPRYIAHSLNSVLNYQTLFTLGALILAQIKRHFLVSLENGKRPLAIFSPLPIFTPLPIITPFPIITPLHYQSVLHSQSLLHYQSLLHNQSLLQYQSSIQYQLCNSI